MKVLSERQKFWMLREIIQHSGITVSVRRRPLKEETHTASTNCKTDIWMQLHPRLNEMQWSCAAAGMIHEFGHCGAAYFRRTKQERRAWKIGIAWVRKHFPMLFPVMMYPERDYSLWTYRDAMKECREKGRPINFKY